MLREAESENGGTMEDENSLQRTNMNKDSIIESKPWIRIGQMDLVGHINSQVQILSSIAGSRTRSFVNGFRRLMEGAAVATGIPAVAGDEKIVVRQRNFGTLVDQREGNFADARVETGGNANLGNFNNSNNTTLIYQARKFVKDSN